MILNYRSRASKISHDEEPSGSSTQGKPELLRLFHGKTKDGLGQMRLKPGRSLLTPTAYTLLPVATSYVSHPERLLFEEKEEMIIKEHLFLFPEIKLEDIMLRGISQAQKDKHCMFSLICGS